MPRSLPRFAPGPFVALYRPLAAGEWELARVPYEDIPCHGYWSPPQAVSGLLLLTRQGETWMSLMPVETESMQLAAECAQGEVVIFGLGMGWLAALCAARREVSRVTVVEIDRALIEFHRELALFERLPDGVGGKVRIVAGDAHDWHADASVDLLLIDIWQPLVGADRLAEVRRMHARVASRAIHFWGQELEIARHAAAAGRPLDEAGIAATVADLGLPLAGPALPGYAARLRGAAANWLDGHWFPGTQVPAGLAPHAHDSANICD